MVGSRRAYLYLEPEVKAQDLDDETLNAIHEGADALYFRDRPKYYGHIAETINGWRESTPAMIKALVKDTQYKIRGPARES